MKEAARLRQPIFGFIWRKDRDQAHVLPHFDYVFFQEPSTLFFRVDIVSAGNYLRCVMNMAVSFQGINTVIKHDAALFNSGRAWRSHRQS
jgi:hypothetical protein